MTDTRNARNAEVKAATRGLTNEHTRTNSINFISSNNSNLIMDIGERMMGDIKRYDFSICPNHEIGCGECGYEEMDKGEYVLYSDSEKQLSVMRDLLIKCSNRLKAVSANAYDYESFSLHSEIETALETDK